MKNKITSHFLGTYMEKPHKPYDFCNQKTNEIDFRQQVVEMDANTVMDKKLDENELRERLHKFR